MKRGITILAIVTALLLSYALYGALIGAPTERTMGDVQRIFYYHVPSAWTAFLLFLINFIASIIYLIRRSIKADILALVSAEVGVVFCTVVLVTGPIWARPVWGIWWAAGDIRLTTTLVLWVIYVSYLVLRRLSMSGQPRKSRQYLQSSGPWMCRWCTFRFGSSVLSILLPSSGLADRSIHEWGRFF